MTALFSRRTRRVSLALGTVLLFLVLAGVTYQSVSNAVERRRFPHPGKMVDVGDHQLHLYCVGERHPSVVLEAPAGGMSMNWAWVQNDLKSSVRVCTYDRSGLGWSEAGDAPYDPMRVPGELHALLQQAGERGPYLLAGQELGSVFAQMFAARYPREVIGLVKIDDPADTAGARRSTKTTSAWPWLARVGLLRVTRSLSRHAAGLPPPANGAAQAFLNRPDHLTRASRELASLDATAAELGTTSRVSSNVDVISVKTVTEQPPIVLASHDQALTVTRALLSAVERARQR